jgi:Acetyltransferase (GNAT) domain
MNDYTLIEPIGKDAVLWNELLAPLPHDIYHTPEYLSLFSGTVHGIAETFGTSPRLFWYGDERRYVLHPVLLKPVNDLSFFPPPVRENAARPLFDAVSPWYYGGPLICAPDPGRIEGLIQGFIESFHRFCMNQGIVSEFVRLHPLLGNHRNLEGILPMEQKSEIVYVDLAQDAESLWNGYKKENRKAINRAINRGVSVEVTRRPEDIGAFYQLYTAAMDRLDARLGYRFSEEFLRRLFSNLGDRAVLFLAKYAGEIVSGSILLGHSPFAHDYLRAFNPAFHLLFPNNLIVHRKILWAKEHGYRVFSLQGGQTRDDGIMRFKLTFSRTTAPFYTYSCIHDPDTYKALSIWRDEYDSRTGGIPPRPSYFPYYRG